MEHLLARDFFAESSLADMVSMFFDVSDPAGQVLVFLLDHDMTVQEAARRLGRDRSTAQRALHSLVKKGLAVRRRVPAKGGGSKFVYSAVPASTLEKRMKRVINAWADTAMSNVKKTLNRIEQDEDRGNF